MVLTVVFEIVSSPDDNIYTYFQNKTDQYYSVHVEVIGLKCCMPCQSRWWSLYSLFFVRSV